MIKVMKVKVPLACCKDLQESKDILNCIRFPVKYLQLRAAEGCWAEMSPEIEQSVKVTKILALSQLSHMVSTVLLS